MGVREPRQGAGAEPQVCLRCTAVRSYPRDQGESQGRDGVRGGRKKEKEGSRQASELYLDTNINGYLNIKCYYRERGVVSGASEVCLDRLLLLWG